MKELGILIYEHLFMQRVGIDVSCPLGISEPDKDAIHQFLHME